MPGLQNIAYSCILKSGLRALSNMALLSLCKEINTTDYNRMSLPQQLHSKAKINYIHNPMKGLEVMIPNIENQKKIKQFRGYSLNCIHTRLGRLVMEIFV